MEAARSFLASPPTLTSRTHLRNCSFTSSSLSDDVFERSLNPVNFSVLMLHEQTTPALTYIPATYLVLHFPTSVHIQEQHDGGRQSSHLRKDERNSLATLDRRLMNAAASSTNEENGDPDEYKSKSIQLRRVPGLWYLFQSLERIQSLPNESENLPIIEAKTAVVLAEKALSASGESALLAEQSKLFGTNLDVSLSPSLLTSDLADAPLEEERTVRSTRLLERRSKRRKATEKKVLVQERNCSGKLHVQRKKPDAFDPTDPVHLFVGPESKLLTASEESDLIMKIQEYFKLEEVKNKLRNQFDREPSLVEWGEAVGLSCRALQSQLYSGKQSREKLIHANLRMVVHIAKQYQGHGLSLPDLLQEGSMGLMRSIEKFKPQVGCRFATYSYWWIRQSIRKAIFRHSRTIRLPENMYGLLLKIKDAKRTCIQQGCHHPTKEEIALCAGMTVEKLEKLLFAARMPVSMQQTAWMDQDTTFQEVTADMAIEAPNISVEKQFMRLHVRKLLSILNPKERKIIKLRYGIGDGQQKSLSEIGAVFGLSKERVRQLESRAMYKLKQCLNSQGLKAYGDLVL